MGYGRFIFDDGDDITLEVRVITCKLVCKGGKDIFEFLLVEVFSGTEEASTKESLFGNCLRG